MNGFTHPTRFWRLQIAGWVRPRTSSCPSSEGIGQGCGGGSAGMPCQALRNQPTAAAGGRRPSCCTSDLATPFLHELRGGLVAYGVDDAAASRQRPRDGLRRCMLTIAAVARLTRILKPINRDEMSCSLTQARRVMQHKRFPTARPHRYDLLGIV